MKSASEIKENTMSIEALKRYGNHDWDCGLLLRCEDCTCGFDAAIKAAQPSAISDERLRKLFLETNTAEPLAEGWPGLERFARAVLAAAQEGK